MHATELGDHAQHVGQQIASTVGADDGIGEKVVDIDVEVVRPCRHLAVHKLTQMSLSRFAVEGVPRQPSTGRCLHAGDVAVKTLTDADQGHLSHSLLQAWGTGAMWMTPSS